jgi:uncharacterized protein with PQ loop repeat
MILVGFVTALAEVPQTTKLLKRKSSDDISLIAWFLIYFGQCSWLRYGIDKGSLSLIICNGVNILFSVTIMFLCVMYSKQYKQYKLKKEWGYKDDQSDG